MALIRQRKLTKQQLRRIQSQQSSASTNETFNDTLLDGVVMAHFGKQLEVKVTSLPTTIQLQPEFNSDEPEPFWQPLQLGDIWRCHTRTNISMIAAGDKVKWVADCNTGFGRIESIEPRHSLINRPDRYHKLKPVASNTDILAIVFASLPAPAPSLIDRYLVVAHQANVEPLLVLNKSDLLDESQQHVVTLTESYQKLGYDFVLTSCNHEQGLSDLQSKIDNKFVVFAGQSGVGKSSLINSLLPSSDQSVNIISENSKLGQHTTTTSRLLPFINDDHTLAKGGIIDTPGIREYGIWHLTPSDVLAGFIELAPLASYCKFRDCKHTDNTKGCALRQAISEGLVSQRRVDSLINLQAEATTKHY